MLEIPLTPGPFGRCPIDGAECIQRPLWDGALLFNCDACGLWFYGSEAKPHDLMERAYEGSVADANMHEYWFRGNFLASEATDFLASPALRLSLRWMDQNVARPATVLDVGCGRGTYLRGLRDVGFTAIGLDLSSTVARVLAGQGFDVHVGPVPTYPIDWPEPTVVSTNFVLHHPTDPVGFLRSIHERFPAALVVLTQGLYPTWTHAFKGAVPRTRPGLPRNVTAWSQRAIESAFVHAGYTDVRLMSTRPSWRDVHLGIQSSGARLAYRLFGRHLGAKPAPADSGAQPSARRTSPSGPMVLGLRALLAAKAWLYWLPATYARIAGLPPAAALVIAGGRADLAVLQDRSQQRGGQDEEDVAGDRGPEGVRAPHLPAVEETHEQHDPDGRE